jgi:hypothetical protein
VNGRGWVPLKLLDKGDVRGSVDRGALPVRGAVEIVPLDSGYGVEVASGPEEGPSGAVPLYTKLVDGALPVASIVPLLLE